jgi:hypothetical protein
VGLTDKGEIAEGFCDFYSQGPKLAAQIEKEREGAFLEYMGDRVDGSLFCKATTPLDMEELCGSLEPCKGISGPLSRLFNCCIRGALLLSTDARFDVRVVNF